MPMNRVQFQKGLSLGEFMERYGTEEGCERELQEQRWPEGFACPACNGREYSNFRRGRLLYFQCCACRHQSSLLSGTMLASSKLPLRRWFQAAYVLTQAKNNVSGLELMRHLGVCYKTAWSMKHKLMEAMWIRERPRTLQGTVQIDEAFLGGEATVKAKPGQKGQGSAAGSGVGHSPRQAGVRVPVGATGHGRGRAGVHPELAEARQPGGLRRRAQFQLRQVGRRSAAQVNRDRRGQAGV